MKHLTNFMLHIIFCNCFIYNGSAVLLSSRNSNDFNLGQMVHEIIMRYFSNFRCIAVITENSSGYNIDNIADFIPGNILKINIYITNEMEADYDSVNELILEALDAKCLGFVFQVSDPVHMISVITKLSRKSNQRANRRLLFLPIEIPTDNNREKHRKYLMAINDLLSTRQMDFYPDLVVARFMPQQNISLTTNVEFVTHSFSGKTTHKNQVILDIWTQSALTGWSGFLNGKNLYPDKVSNLMGKSLVLSTFMYAPYGIVNQEATPVVFDGTETRILLEFCKMVNATYDIYVDSENEWGEIYENETGNGILGAVVEDKAEFGFGAIYLWSYEFNFIDYTMPYIRTGITCIAPTPHLLSGWLTPILPFTFTSWTAVGASVVAAAISLYFVTKATQKFSTLETVTTGHAAVHNYTTLWDCLFNALGLLVLQTPPDERTSTRLVGPNRHVLAWLTIMFLVITTSYCSGLASVLTVPRFGPPIETVTDLLNRKVAWAATHPAWIFSLREGRDKKTRQIVSQFRIMTKEEMRTHASIGDIAFSVERLPAGHYAVGDYISEEDVAKRLRLMKQDIYFEHVPTVMRKGSPYSIKLNKLIHHLMDSGVILKWEEQVVSSFLEMKIQRAVSQSRSSTKHGPTKLKMKHIEGGLYLLLLGLLLSTAAFFAELIFSKYCV